MRKYLNRKRGQIKKKNPLFGTEETGRGVTHLPLWRRPELGVGRIKIKKKTAIGTHTLTHICTPKTLHKHADTNTYYYYIKRNKSSVLEHIDYYYYY